MPAKNNSNNKFVSPAWCAAGAAIGFACGYLLLDSAISGIILAAGLGVAMGIAGKSSAK